MLLTPAACRSILAKDSVVAPLRCGLLLKRAEARAGSRLCMMLRSFICQVLHQKWQHKAGCNSQRPSVPKFNFHYVILQDALDDCVAVLRIGLERPRALRIAAEAAVDFARRV